MSGIRDFPPLPGGAAQTYCWARPYRSTFADDDPVPALRSPKSRGDWGCAGKLSSEWVLSAIACVAEFGGPSLLQGLVKLSGSDAVTVRLCSNGWWEDVRMTAELPHMDPGGDDVGPPAFCHLVPRDSAPLWPAYVEKGLAYLAGGYGKLRTSNADHNSSPLAAALRALTGCPAFSYSAAGTTQRDMFGRMRAWLGQGYVVCLNARAGGVEDPQPRPGDVQPKRGYVVLGTEDLGEDQRLVCVRSLWQPDLSGDAVPPGSAAEHDGVWFDFEGLFLKAESVTVCRMSVWQQQVRTQTEFVLRRRKSVAAGVEPHLCCLMLWIEEESVIDVLVEPHAETATGGGQIGAFLLVPSVSGCYKLAATPGLVANTGTVVDTPITLQPPACGRPVIVVPCMLSAVSEARCGVTVAALLSRPCAAARRCSVPSSLNRLCMHLACSQWGERSPLGSGMWGAIWACGTTAALTYRNASPDTFAVTCDLSRGGYHFGSAELPVSIATATAVGRSEGFVAEATAAKGDRHMPQVEWAYTSEPGVPPAEQLAAPGIGLTFDPGTLSPSPGVLYAPGLGAYGGPIPQWAVGFGRPCNTVPSTAPLPEGEGSVEEKALQRLRDVGETLAKEMQPRPESAPPPRTNTSKSPRRRQQASRPHTASGRAVRAARLARPQTASPQHVGSPRSDDDSDGVYLRLSRQPAPVRHTPLGSVVRNVRSRLTRAEQVQSTERLYRDCVHQRRLRLEHLERMHYGNPEGRACVTQEDITNSIARLYTQSISERKNKNQLLREKYLGETKTRVLTREDQGEMLGRLFDSLGKDGARSRALDEKYNSESRNKRVAVKRSAEDMKKAAERLAQPKQ